MNLLKLIVQTIYQPLIIAASAPFITACPIYDSFSDGHGRPFLPLRHGSMQIGTPQLADSLIYNRPSESAWRIPTQAASMLEYSLVKIAWEDGVALGKKVAFSNQVKWQ